MHEFKIVLLGAKNAGKTTLLSAFIDEKFNPAPKQTFGPVYRQHQVISQEINLSLQFIDTDGSAKFNDISSMYCKDAQAILLVCDLSQADFATPSQEILANIKPPLTEKTIIYLIGTKLDRAQNQAVAQQQLLTLLHQHDNIAVAHLVNTKKPAEVKQVFDDLISELVEKYKDTPLKVYTPITPTPVEVPKPSKRKAIWQRIKAHPWRYTIGLLLAISLIILLTVPIAGQAVGFSAAVSWLLMNTAIQLGTSLLVTKIILAVSLGAVAFFLPSILAAGFNLISRCFKFIRNQLDGLSHYLSNQVYKTDNSVIKALLHGWTFLTYLGSAVMHFCSQIFKCLSLCITGRKKQPPASVSTEDDIENSYSKMPNHKVDATNHTEEPAMIPVNSPLFTEEPNNLKDSDPHPLPSLLGRKE